MRDYSCEDARRWLVMLTERGQDLPVGMQFHLTQCPQCRGLAVDYQASLSAYRSVTNDDLDVPDFGAVREATRTKLQRRRGWSLGPFPRWVWISAPIAVGAAVALAVWLGGGGSGEALDGVDERGDMRAPDIAAAAPMLREVGGSEAVAEGAAIVTDAEPRVFEDSRRARVSVEAQSEVAVATWRADESVIRLSRGAVRAKVVKRAPGQSFEVRTPEVRVTVRGTEFTVRRRDGVTRVEVHEGVVLVEPASGKSLRLAAGGVWSSAPPSRATEPVPQPAQSAGIQQVPPAVAPKPVHQPVHQPVQTTRSPRTVVAPPANPKTATPPAAPERDGAPDKAAAPTLSQQLAKARALLVDAKDAEAMALLEQLRAAGHDGASVLALLGDAQRIRKRYGAAVATYEKALAKASGRLAERLLADLAGTQAQNGDKTAAAATWQRYLAEAPNGIARAKAHLFVAQRGIDAEKHLRAIVTEHTKRREATVALERLGRLLLDAKRYGDAATLLRAFVTSGNARRAEAAYVGLLRAAKAQGDKGGFGKLLDAYRKRFPKGRRAAEVNRLAGDD